MSEWRRRGSARWGPQKRDSDWNWSYGKPPRIPDELQVPRWEVEFCKYEGMQWHNLLNAKNFTHLYDNVLNWDDSEGEKAFRNAKARYWARINGFESDIPTPDPDIYIDKVDQDELMDPHLYDGLSDAEREYPCDNNMERAFKGEEEESVIIWGDFFLTHQTSWPCSDLPVIPTGWGDPPEPQEPNREGKIVPTGWGEADAEWNVKEGNNDGNYGYHNSNYGHAWRNENQHWDIKGNEPYDNHGDAYGKWGGWNKKRWNGNGNGGGSGSNQKRWRKKNSNRVYSEDKSRLLCSRDNGSTRHNDGWNMQRRTVT